MKNIVGVRTKEKGKLYFVNPQEIQVNRGDKVIVETDDEGEDFVEVVFSKKNLEDEKVLKNLKKIIRIATKKDIERNEECKKIEKEAFKVCEEKIKEHKLDMKLIDVESKFDNSKMLFYFKADGRIDFRELVRELAAIYRTRIELRQLGVRDEVKRIGGNGVCGRELCCCTFLNNFEAVSIKMAKDQNISLNPSKISGNCGRLMCCLKYEDEAYLDKLKNLPNVGAIVKTEDGEGEVDSVEILKEQLRVKFKKDDSYAFKKYDAKDVKVIKDATKEKIDQEELENKKRIRRTRKIRKAR